MAVLLLEMPGWLCLLPTKSSVCQECKEKDPGRSLIYYETLSGVHHPYYQWVLRRYAETFIEGSIVHEFQYKEWTIHGIWNGVSCSVFIVICNSWYFREFLLSCCFFLGIFISVCKKLCLDCVYITKQTSYRHY